MKLQGLPYLLWIAMLTAICLVTHNPQNLHKISYRGTRLIEASTVAAMLNGDHAARRKIDEAVLTRKAADWRYEREWRLVGPRGRQDSLLELEEVVFGMRCSHTIKFTIVSVLANRPRPVKFYEMHERSRLFRLEKMI